MTAVDRERQAAARAAQGLPPKITDPVVLDRLAVLFSAPAASVDARSPHARASAGAGGSEVSKRDIARAMNPGDAPSKAAG